MEAVINRSVEYGAECVVVMPLLLPTPADEPPDAMTQTLSS
jgi:hypothetical protein